jgi:hypothetical protein
MTNTTSNQPADNVRLGAVQAAIWRNTDSEGRTRYSVTFEKRYRDQNGDWLSTNSFNRDELLTLAKAADIANSRIFELQATDREESAANGAAKSKAKGASR